MDIYLSVNNGETVMTIPVIPPQFTITKPQSTEQFETISRGDLQLIGLPKLKGIVIESFFPIRDYPFLRDRSKKGWEYVDMIDSWIEQKLPIRLVISDTPINMAVAVKDFEYTIQSDGDLWYNLDLEEFDVLDDVAAANDLPPIIAELNEEVDMEQLEKLQAQVDYLTTRVDELANPFIYNYMDDNMPEWAREAVQWCVNNGIIQGTDMGLNLDERDLRWCVILFRIAKLAGNMKA